MTTELTVTCVTVTQGYPEKRNHQNGIAVLIPVMLRVRGGWCRKWRAAQAFILSHVTSEVVFS